LRYLAAAQDDHASAFTLARESRDRARAAGDQRTAAQAGNALGIAMLTGGRLVEAREVFAECLAAWRRLGDKHGTAMAHGNLAMVALRLADVDTASWHTSECLRLERAAGNTRGIMLALLCLGEIALSKSDAEAADTHLAEALSASRQVGDVLGEAMALHLHGLAALAAGDARLAIRRVAEAMGLRRDAGDRDDLSVSLDTLAELLTEHDGAYVLAARLLSAADALRAHHHLKAPYGPAAATREAVIARHEAELDAATLQAARSTGALAPLDVLVSEAIDHAESVGG